MHPHEATAWWMTRSLSPVLVNLNVHVIFSDSLNVPKLWLVFSNWISASPLPEAKANNPKMDNMVVSISFFICVNFNLRRQIYDNYLDSSTLVNVLNAILTIIKNKISIFMRDSYFRDLLKFINMVSVKLKFRSSSIDGNLGSLYYQVVYQRVVRQISTPYKIMKKEWDANSCTLVIKVNDKDRYNYLQVLQKRIQWDKKKLMRIIDLYINSGIVFSVDSIVEAYKNEINDMILPP